MEDTVMWRALWDLLTWNQQKEDARSDQARAKRELLHEQIQAEYDRTHHLFMEHARSSGFQNELNDLKNKYQITKASESAMMIQDLRQPLSSNWIWQIVLPHNKFREIVESELPPQISYKQWNTWFDQFSEEYQFEIRPLIMVKTIPFSPYELQPSEKLLDGLPYRFELNGEVLSMPIKGNWVRIGMSG